MLKLTKEEQVFAEQLHLLRKHLHQLKIEEAAHVDRLLTILRGHQEMWAEGDTDSGILVNSFKSDEAEDVLVTKFGRSPIY